MLLDGTKQFGYQEHLYPPHRHDDEDLFDHHVAADNLYKEIVLETFNPAVRKKDGRIIEGFRRAYYTRKGEEWRVSAWRLLWSAAEKQRWNEGFERLSSMLFGYEEWQTEWWLTFMRENKGGWGGQALNFSVGETRLRSVEAAGLRAFPPPSGRAQDRSSHLHRVPGLLSADHAAASPARSGAGIDCAQRSREVRRRPDDRPSSANDRRARAAADTLHSARARTPTPDPAAQAQFAPAAAIAPRNRTPTQSPSVVKTFPVNPLISNRRGINNHLNPRSRVSVPHVNRMIRCLREESLATIEDQHIVIHDLASLSALASFEEHYLTRRLNCGLALTHPLHLLATA